jgi:hypothetical protein
MNEYHKQAEDFAAKYNVEMKATYLGHFKRLGDRSTANFRITLKRGKKEYSFDYSDSINDSWRYKEFNKAWQKGLPMRLKEEYYPESAGRHSIGRWYVQSVVPKPHLYDILSCIQKYDPGTFEDFCGDFGYDTDSRSAEKIYYAVRDEGRAIEGMFSDCLDELQEIC